MPPSEHRDEHPTDHDRVGDDQKSDPIVLNDGRHWTRSDMAVCRWAAPAGRERDEDQETEKKKRERTGPNRPTRRPLAQRFHSWRKPREAVGRPLGIPRSVSRSYEL